MSAKTNMELVRRWVEQVWNIMHLLILADQKIVEVWTLQNTATQLQQMGATLHPPADTSE